MPRAIPKACRKPGCPKLSHSRNGWCEEHQSSSWERSHQGRSASQRGYGAAWRKLRKRILERDNWLCQVCMSTGQVSQASAVDHIKPKSKGGTDDERNLQSICETCHKAKTSEESQHNR